MRVDITIDDPEELEEMAVDIIAIYEDPPEGANPENPDDPLIGEDGVLVVGTEKITVQANFDQDLLSDDLSFSVNYIGWDETLERMEEIHGLEPHPPAWVTLSLKRSWKSETGEILAEYSVSAEHQ